MTELSLRPYQQETLDKFLSDPYYPNVFIGDEMGTGKTVQAMALDHEYRKEAEPDAKTLVVAPLSGVVDSWVRHFREWFPSLKVRRIDPKDRESFLEPLAAGAEWDPKVWDGSWPESWGSNRSHEHYPDVFVMHWEALRLMTEGSDTAEAIGYSLEKPPWSVGTSEPAWLHIIADEVHKAKNRRTQQTKALKSIDDVLHKTGLTGTPMVNRPDELWSILHWLYNDKGDREEYFKYWHRKLLRSYWRFYNRYTEYIVPEPRKGYHKITGVRNEEELKELMDPFFIRRLKKDVMKDLPPKVYQSYEVDLHPQQRKAYNSMRDNMIAWIGEHEDQPVVAPITIAKLTRLQQLAIAYGEIVELPPKNNDPTGSPRYEVRLQEPSAKLDALVDILDDLGDSKAVVFSQYSQAIDLAIERLEAHGYKTGKITGDVPNEKRSEAIDDFQHTPVEEDGAQVLCATITAGGQGIDLFAASTVVFLDRDWSPALNQQAEDRLHRMGQTDTVHVIDIDAKNTVDQYRGKKLEQKWSWIKRMVGA